MKNRFIQRGIYFLLFAFYFLLLSSCKQIDISEKNTTIPRYEWRYDFTPSFEFLINDTASRYALFVVIRHTDAYRYNNICLNISMQLPGDSLQYQRFDLPLGSDAKGWEGTGMDDIWEVRKPITPGPFKFGKPGNYRFTIAQQMRENPLNDIMSIGMRVEKVK